MIVATDIRPRPEGKRVTGVVYERLDVRSDDLAAILARHKVGTVVHLATIVTPGKHSSPEVEYDVDVRGTENVLRACLAASVSRLVVTSSGAAYGYHADNSPLLTEDAPLRGNETFAYAYHKRLVEERLAAARVLHPELSLLVFRPGTILGEGAANQITDIFTKPVIVGLRESETPFVFVWDEDVVRAIATGVRDAWSGRTFGGDGVVTLRGIAARLTSLVESTASAAIGHGALRKVGATQYGPSKRPSLRTVLFFRPSCKPARFYIS